MHCKISFAAYPQRIRRSGGGNRWRPIRQGIAGVARSRMEDAFKRVLCLFLTTSCNPCLQNATKRARSAPRFFFYTSSERQIRKECPSILASSSVAPAAAGTSFYPCQRKPITSCKTRRSAMPNFLRDAQSNLRRSSRPPGVRASHQTR
jgi:hypothetical protein